MRLLALFSAVLLGQVSGLVARDIQPFSDQKIVELLVNRPHLLPPESYKLLQSKVQRNVLLKRDPQKNANANAMATIIGATGAYLQSLFPFNPLAPTSKVAEIQHQTPDDWSWPNVRRTKIRYGPYRIAATSENNVDAKLLDVKGMSHTFKVGAKKPCMGDCKILAISGSLEYASGEPAETDTGAWFHHSVLFNSGPQVNYTFCKNEPIEILYMNGNEKTRALYGVPTANVRSGYNVHDSDKFVLNTQLMNLEDKVKWVWVAMTYDYILQPGWNVKSSKLNWMSMGDLIPRYCADVFINPWGQRNVTEDLRPLKEVFVERSMPMPFPTKALFFGAAAHMHDGGIGVEIYHNQKMVCNSTAIYGKNEGGMSSHGGHGQGGAASAEHIVKQTICEYNDPLPVNAGDTFHMAVSYDFKRHPGMKDASGNYTTLMGITGMLTADP